jgi:phage gp29-like protein
VGDFAEFLETYGLPLIMGKYHANATDKEKSSLMRAVTRLGHDARGIMPKEMELEISNITGSGAGDPHLMMIDWAERSQSKAILGQTLSAEAKATGMGSGVADLHNEVRHDILRSDARKLAETLTRDLVYPLLALNGKGGDALRRCPRWVFDLGKAEDLAAYAQHLPVLAAHGLKIPLDYLYDKLRIPKPAEGEALFGATPTLIGMDMAAPAGGVPIARLRASLGDLAARADDKDLDVLASQVDRLAADTRPAMAAWLKKIEAMLEAAESLEEFQSMLLAGYSELDAKDMEDALALALAAMNLAGRSEVEDEA